MQCRKIQKLSVHNLFITTHIPFQVIHFSSVDTDHLGDSKLFTHVVLVYDERGTRSFRYEYHSPFKNSCMWLFWHWTSSSKHFEGTVVLQNIWNYLPSNTVSDPRRPESSAAPLWDPLTSTNHSLMTSPNHSLLTSPNHSLMLTTVFGFVDPQL